MNDRTNRKAEWIAFYTIIRKEVQRIIRIWSQTLLPSVITTTLYFLIFGNLMGSRVGNLGGFPYSDFIAPGLVMMSIITNSYGNVSSSFFGAKFSRSIEELLVSPVSEHTIILGYMTGGIFRGLMVGILVSSVALFFTNPVVTHPVLAVILTLLVSSLFSLAGLLNALKARNFDDISIIPTFILTPLTYLGGVFYSVHMLPDFWRFVSYANPILYMVSVFRFAFLGASDIPPWPALLLLITLTLALYGVCWFLVRWGKGLRN